MDANAQWQERARHVFRERKASVVSRGAADMSI